MNERSANIRSAIARTAPMFGTTPTFALTGIAIRRSSRPSGPVHRTCSVRMP